MRTEKEILEKLEFILEEEKDFKMLLKGGRHIVAGIPLITAQQVLDWVLCKRDFPELLVKNNYKEE